MADAIAGVSRHGAAERPEARWLQDGEVSSQGRRLFIGSHPLELLLAIVGRFGRAGRPWSEKQSSERRDCPDGKPVRGVPQLLPLAAPVPAPRHTAIDTCPARTSLNAPSRNAYGSRISGRECWSLARGSALAACSPEGEAGGEHEGSECADCPSGESSERELASLCSFRPAALLSTGDTSLRWCRRRRCH